MNEDYPGDWAIIKKAFRGYQFTLIDFIAVCLAISSGIIWYHGNDLVRSMYIGVLCAGVIWSLMTTAGQHGMMNHIMDEFDPPSMKKREPAETKED